MLMDGRDRLEALKAVQSMMQWLMRERRSIILLRFAPRIQPEPNDKKVDMGHFVEHVEDSEQETLRGRNWKALCLC